MSNKDDFRYIGYGPQAPAKNLFKLFTPLFTTKRGLSCLLIATVLGIFIAYVLPGLRQHSIVIGFMVLPVIVCGLSGSTKQEEVATDTKWRTLCSIKGLTGFTDKFEKGELRFDGQQLSWLLKNQPSVNISELGLKASKIREVQKGEHMSIKPQFMRVIECSDNTGKQVLLAVSFNVVDTVAKVLI